MIKRICCITAAVIILVIFLAPVIDIRSYAEDEPEYIPIAFEGYQYYYVYEIKDIGYFLDWHKTSGTSPSIFISMDETTYLHLTISASRFKFFETYDEVLYALYHGDNSNFITGGSFTGNYYFDMNPYWGNDKYIQLYNDLDDSSPIVYPILTNNNLRNYNCLVYTNENITNQSKTISILQQLGLNISNIPVTNILSYIINTHNCTASVDDGFIQSGSDLTITFTPDNGYSFYGLSNVFQVNPANAFSSTTIDYPTYYGEGITITFHNITSSFTISINAAEYFTISYDLQNITVSNQSSAILAGQTYITTVAIENENYEITYAEISMGGIDITNQSWDPETNTITAVSVNGNIAIVIYAELNEQGQLSNIQLKLQSIISILLGQSDLKQQEIDLLGDIKDMLDNPDPDDDIDSTDDQSRIQEEISNYDELETSLSDQAASNVDEVMDTSIDEDVVQFMLDFQQGMSWLYDNELVIAGLGSCGVFMVIGFLIFGKKGHG